MMMVLIMTTIMMTTVMVCDDDDGHDDDNDDDNGNDDDNIFNSKLFWPSRQLIGCLPCSDQTLLMHLNGQILIASFFFTFPHSLLPTFI